MVIAIRPGFGDQLAAALRAAGYPDACCFAAVTPGPTPGAEPTLRIVI